LADTSEPGVDPVSDQAHCVWLAGHFEFDLGTRRRRPMQMRWWPWVLGFLLAALLGVIALWSARDGDEARGSDASSQTFADDFEGAAMAWRQGDTLGSWHVQYDSYGHVGLSGRGSLDLAPQVADDPDTTHAALVTSTQRFTGDIDITVRAQTTDQLRTGSPPNPWEVAWVAWHYQDDHRFYYVILRPNGWELGKVDNTKLDADGPDCLWPSYENCRFPGAQRFLATGSSPTFDVAEWHEFRISQSGDEIVLWGNGQELTRYTDLEDPYLDGHIGLYTEDAAVSFDTITVTGTQS
jgi:predicted outer membrane lipoprotein